jgi:hypothetical protein
MAEETFSLEMIGLLNASAYRIPTQEKRVFQYLEIRGHYCLPFWCLLHFRRIRKFLFFGHAENQGAYLASPVTRWRIGEGSWSFALHVSSVLEQRNGMSFAKFAFFASLTSCAILGNIYREVIDLYSSQTWSLSVQRKTNAFQAAENPATTE